MTKYNRARIVRVYGVLAVLLLAAVWVDINAGYRPISLAEMMQIFSGGGEASLRYTLLELRLPRVLTSLLVGVGLSVAGCVLQGLSRNDMAEPGILGLNAGAGLFVAVFIVFFAGGSLTTMLMLRMSDSDYAFVQNWLSGNIWGASWSNVRMLAIGLPLLALFMLYKSRTLNVLGLGTQAATGLGVAVSRDTLLLLGGAVAMSSLCCAVGGGMSFVGLVCPHLARRLVGPNFRVLIGASLLTGALLMTVADSISRTLLAPNELSIGIVAAVIGAPYFLYLLVKQ